MSPFKTLEKKSLIWFILIQSIYMLRTNNYNSIFIPAFPTKGRLQNLSDSKHYNQLVWVSAEVCFVRQNDRGGFVEFDLQILVGFSIKES